MFKRFSGNSKLILTESDLKCWLFRELMHEIEQGEKPSLSVHTEVTHYPRNEGNKSKYFMRDLTILDSQNLKMNEELWEKRVNGDHTLSKGFKHNGPAMHFELKLIRQGQHESSMLKIDSSDIENLNNVNPEKRAYTIVWVSKNDNCNLGFLEEQLKKSFETFKNTKLAENDLLRFYLMDQKCYKIYKLDFENNLPKISAFN